MFSPGLSGVREGVLVAPEDAEGFAAGLKLLLTQLTRRSAASKAAGIASRRWDLQRLLADMAALYRQLLAEKRMELPS